MSVSEIAGMLSHEDTGGVFLDIPLSDFTTFCIGGRAQVLVVPRDLVAVRRTVELCRQFGASLHILGAGSNVVVPDQGVDGVVLCLHKGLNSLKVDQDLILAGAGVHDRDLAWFAAGLGISGFEWIFDIPGSVGGGIYMNAGNNDGEMSRNLVSVTWLAPDGELFSAPVEELELGYRSSRFQAEPGLILEAQLKGSGPGRPEDIREEMFRIRDLRRDRFPAETMCAGSIFKRPPGDYAGRLIEVSGCGGMRRGQAMVSPKHKGFIVNTGGATASQVLDLIELVRDRVKAETGVMLESEVRLFGTRPFLAF